MGWWRPECRGFNSNYFYREINSSDPYCSDENMQLTDNCLRVPSEGCSNVVVPQKSAAQCRAFCSLRWSARRQAFIPPCARCRRNRVCQPHYNKAGTQYFSCPRNCCESSHPPHGAHASTCRLPAAATAAESHVSLL